MSTVTEQEQPDVEEYAFDAQTGAETEPARVSEAKRVLSLAWTLAITDWKLKFYGSVLGVLWTLVRPFAFFGVIYFVFTEVAGLDENVKYYGVYILLSLVLFTFFGEVTSNSVQSLVARENLLRKMHFNPIVVPLAIAMTALMNLGMTLIAVLIFVFANGLLPTWGWLEFIPLTIALTLLSTGVGMMLAALYVSYRDMQPIWEVGSQILFYGSAVLYPVTSVPEQFQGLLLCNPLAAIFTQVRHAVIDPTAPSAAVAIGGGARILVPIGLGVAVTLIGLWTFLRASPRVAENL